MKKLLLGFLAIATMASCVKEQTVVTPDQKAISFGNFVQHTKAAIDPSFNNDDNKVTSFYVWGFMDKNTGVVFNEELVEWDETKAAWTYTNLAYWAPNKSYKFAAIAPAKNDKIQVTLADNNKYMSAEGVLGTVAFENENGTVDLLYAEDGVDTPTTIPTDPEKVHFTFQHLLSKVKFTFTNGLSENEHTTMAITDVKMVVPAKGTVDLAVKKPFVWNVSENETITLEFGKAVDKADDTNTQLAFNGVAEVENERLTIPLATTTSVISSYEVSFNVTIYQGTEEAVTIQKTSTIVGSTLVAGKCYNFKATLNAENLGLKQIDFEVDVEEWDHNHAEHDIEFLN